MTFLNRLSPAWRNSILVFVSVRVVASLIAIIGVSAVPIREGAEKLTGVSKLYSLIFGVWYQWDTAWYLRIAHDGYSAQSAAFMPFYPLLVRSLHEVTRLDLLTCGILISNIAAIVVFYLLYRITELEFDEATARRTLWFQAFFPGSLFLLTAYTESLFLAFVLGAFFQGRRGKWLPAALCIFFAGLTRNLGVFLVLPLAWEFYRQKQEGVKTPWLKLGWLAIGPLGLASYMAFLFFRTGDPLAFVNAQAFWSRHPLFPLKTIIIGLQQAWAYSGSYLGGVYVLDAVAVVGALITGVMVLLKLRLAFGIYFWTGLIIPLSSVYDGHVFTSCPRYCGVLFPAFMVLGNLCRKLEVERVVLTSFASLYAVGAALFVSSQWFY